MINEERINVNYARWIDRLKKYNCYSERLVEELGEKIKDASFAMQESTGCAYQGSMLHVVLNSLCTLAIHLNETAFEKHPHLQANTNMLMRVLLLQHISKAEMFVFQSNSWKAKNGQIYEFNDKLISCLKCGERSLYLCMKYGIELTEEEYEAIRIIDKEETPSNAYMTPLCQIVKMANQLVAIEIRQQYICAQKHETIEK